jgi:type IV secretion system protein TrbL
LKGSGKPEGTGEAPTPEGAAPAPAGQPAWAAAMKRCQTMTHAATVAAHTLRSGDGGGGGSSVDVSEKD